MPTQTSLVRAARSLALAGASLSLVAGLAAAQSAAPAALPLPPAKELIARYVTATGGETALAKRTSLRTRGQFSIASAGLTGDMEVLAARPNKTVMRISVVGLGDIMQGYDGTVGWETNPMQGPRLLTGKELDAIREEADFGVSSRRGANVVSAETVERTEMNGEACHKVKLTWRSGRETFDCYSVATGLLVGTVARRESPMGTVEVTSLLSEYKDFGGQKVATRVSQQMMGQQQSFTVTEVEYDVVDPSAFELPAPIRALTEKKP